MDTKKIRKKIAALDHGPDECRDCLAEMSGPIAVPGWLAGEMDDFSDRQDFAAAWGGR